MLIKLIYLADGSFGFGINGAEDDLYWIDLLGLAEEDWFVLDRRGFVLPPTRLQME